MHRVRCREGACEAILAGILGRSFLVIPGHRANFAYLLSRSLPKRLAHAISGRIVARALAGDRTAG